MARSLKPYIEILESFVEGRIGIAEFRSQTIHQCDHVDAGVDWRAEWDKDIESAINRMESAAEVLCPEAPEESYISDEELLKESTETLRKLRDAVRRREGDSGG